MEDIEDLRDPKITKEDPNAPPRPLKLDAKYHDPITLKLIEYTKELIKNPTPNNQKKLNKRYRITPRKSTLVRVARQLDLPVLSFFIKKIHKSTSGVAVISVMTAASVFSCKYDCHMCPKYPDYPRSYVPGEPTSQRAERLNFDAVLQLLDRCQSLFHNGHPIDKLEIIILGGTWCSYPLSYQIQFVRDIYYAANIFNEWIKLIKYPGDPEPEPESELSPPTPLRRRLSLEEEIHINQTESRCRIIGMTPETRPDTINSKTIHQFRKFGFTRVQLGIQHTDDVILKKINRMCKTKHNIRGIRLLKEAGFKVDIHLMLNLPDTTPESDLKMMQTIIESPDFQADHWKIYPTSVTPYTKIKEWYDAKTYVPYPDEELIDIILKILPTIPIQVRVNRIFRDIPSHEIIGGVNIPNLRQILDDKCIKLKIKQRDIRAREVKNKPFNPTIDQPKIFIKIYPASDGTEYFISYENHDQTTLYGFIRLRFNNKKTSDRHYIPALRNAALIRELHVYGSLIKTKDQTTTQATQHKGIGQLLVKRAELLSRTHKYSRVAIIAGVGVREYYEKKLGYHLEDTYMVKDISPSMPELTHIQHVPDNPNLPMLDDIDWTWLRDLLLFLLIIKIIYDHLIESITT